MNPNPRSGRPAWMLRRAALCFLLWIACGSAPAHNWTLTAAEARFSSDGAYEIEFFYDFDAMLAGVPPGHMAPEIFEFLAAEYPAAKLEEDLTKIQESLRRHLRVRFDGGQSRFDVEFPDKGKPRTDWILPEGPWPGARALLKGRAPAGAKAFTFKASAIFGPVALKFGADPNGDMTQFLDPGAESAPLELSWRPGPAAAGEGAPPPALADTATTSTAAPVDAPSPDEHAPESALVATPGPAAATHFAESADQLVIASKPPSRASVAFKYLALGFEHILPKGLDHILFVLGLYLLSRKAKPLLWQVTAFTLAHSVTLALSMYEVIRLPASVVEPLIAISIAWIAIENTITTEMKPWRPGVVFLFGLLHGMGFAGVLTELGLPKSRFITALITFNVGVELGQLAVLAGAAVSVGWFAEKAWYRRRIVIPASALIGMVALYWTWERIFGGA